MSVQDEFIDEPCLNCGDTTPGRYCRACGQRKGEVRVSMRRLLADVLEDQLSINSTLPRTLAALFLHPGRLTREYARGRIASYIAPFRLYLVASVLFFLTLSVSSRTGMPEVDATIGRTPAASAADSTITADAADADTTAAAGAREPAAPPPTGQERAGEGRQSNDNLRFGIYFSEEDMQGDSINWSNVINTGIPVLDEMIEARARSMGRMEPEAAIRQLASSFLKHAPTAMFVLLPVFALLLKLFYVRTGRYYVEHFVFALHYHAFAFLLFTAIILLPNILRPALLLIWLVLYLPIALKRVYEQGYFLTFLKWAIISIAYSFMIGIGMFTTAIIAFLLG